MVASARYSRFSDHYFKTDDSFSLICRTIASDSQCGSFIFSLSHSKVSFHIL